MGWAASCAAGGCTPILTNLPTVVAVVLLSVVVVAFVLGWWAARGYERRRRTHTIYEFDDHGRMRRVPPVDDSSDGAGSNEGGARRS